MKLMIAEPRTFIICHRWNRVDFKINREVLRGHKSHDLSQTIKYGK